MTPPRNGAPLLVALLVLAAVVLAVWRNWGEVSVHLREIAPARIGLSLVLALLAPVFTLLGWRVLLADLGERGDDSVLVRRLRSK